MTENVEIFPWSANFETGIKQIDEQHKQLVLLLNSLVSHLAFQSDAPTTDKIFEELKDYVTYHFACEEAIWQKHFEGDSWEKWHALAHTDFVAEVIKIKEDSERPYDETIELIVKFLTHWLAHHILDSDKRMAKVVLALPSGVSLARAKEASNEEMSGATRVLIETLMSMYDKLANSAVLMSREIYKRQQAEAENQRAKEAADAANRAKSDFLANMSHEIRTPINTILGMLYLALKMDMPAPLHNYLSKTQGAANSLLGIINDILDFSKIEAGKLEVECIEFNLNIVLEQLIDSLNLLVEQKGLELLIHYDPNIPPDLIGDPLRIGQILLNLCSNAIKFTQQGQITLSLQSLNITETDITLQISVSDTGIGMTAEEQGKVFQKFTQADQSTTRQFGGTGLGLVICKHLVGLMGGRIWIECSEPGKGSTFCCTLQLKIVQQAQLPSQHELLAQTEQLLKGIRILVVDNNVAAREILTQMLQLFHLEVCTAVSGVTAMELLTAPGEHSFDLVLMDWYLSDMNGDELMRSIHAHPAIQIQPKVLIMTAQESEEVRQLATQAGADGFMLNTVSPSTLLDTLTTVLKCKRILSPCTAPEEQALAIAMPNIAGTYLLLVEDNELNREFAVELLRSMNIFVDEAVNGEEAVTMVQQRSYDAVLMDIQMPVMDGLDASRKIRALARQPAKQYFADLPIIAMTARALVQDTETCLAAGMNDYVSKPIMPNRLLTVLAKWLPQNSHKGMKTQTASTQANAPDYPADLLRLKTTDARQGIYQIGGNANAYRQQLHRFRNRYFNAVSKLQLLITEQGIQAGAEYCHALKGVVCNFSANELFASLTQLDTLLQRGEMPAPETFDSVKQLLQQLMDEIDGLIPSETVPAVACKILDYNELTAKLALLATLLENDVVAALTLLTELQSSISGSDCEQALLAIVSKVDQFAIDEALAEINTLITQLSQRNSISLPHKRNEHDRK